MWKKWIAFSGVLSLIILLDPTHTPAQPGGGKGGFGKGGGFPSGGTGAPGGGSGFPGGGDYKRKDGSGNTGFPGGTAAPGGGMTIVIPGGDKSAPGGGFGRDRGPGGGTGAPGGFGQPGGGMGTPGGGPGGGGPGGGRRGMDPEQAWAGLQRLTGSTGDTVDLSAIAPQTRDMLRGMTERAGGIPLPESGIMTKAAYLDHHARSEAARASAAPGGGMDNGRGRGPGGPGGFGGDPNGGFGGGNGGWGGGNGGWGGGNGGWDQKPFEKKDTEEERPIAMRYGKLPKDLPSWFNDLDTDKDGQIGLYEWRKAGKDMAEFTAMDLNGDGFVTADEYLRFARQSNIDKKIADYEETGARPANWGIGSTAPGDTKGGRNGGGPGTKGGFPGGPGSGGKGDNTGKSDTSKSDKTDTGDKKSGNPWGKGKN